MSRVYNFSAGSVLPEEVLQKDADDMMDYKGSGMSVMEMSHRGKIFDGIIKEAEADLRDIMNIPDNYKVLFLQGGASQFFAEVPMNMMKNKKAGYIIKVSGLKRLSRKLKSMVKQLSLHHQQIKLSHIFLTVQIFLLQMIWTMFIFVRTIQFMERSLKHYLIRRARI